MPFAPATRAFLTAALVHLAVAAAAVMLGTRVEAFTGRWDLVVWLLLLGFIGFTTAGFALHLFPTLSRRSPPPSWAGSISFLLAETGLVLGAAGLAGPPAPLSPGGIFSLGALLVLAGDTVILAVFLRALAEPRLPSRGPEPRPGDAVTVPLFLGSWIAAVGSGGLFFLSGRTAGPGFGWWIAAVHLFVLGHAVLLIVAVSLRLLPRSLDADVGRPTVALLAALAGAGALLVPLGMLRIPRSASPLLGLLAAPEAAFTVLFLAVILVLLHRARHPRPEVGIPVAASLFMVVGGFLGLSMAEASTDTLVVPHAVLNLFGFVGLFVLFMSFLMIAPFQRISHLWTRRMLGILSMVWAIGVVGMAVTLVPGTPVVAGWVAPLAGALLVGVTLAWGAGTIPTLYPALNPLPGLSSREIRALRDRWEHR